MHHWDFHIYTFNFKFDNFSYPGIQQYNIIVSARFGHFRHSAPVDFIIYFPLFQARLQKLPFTSMQAAAPSGTSVQDLKWNPTQASTLAACLSDGSMMILDVTDSVKVQAQLPASSGITCSE